MIPKVRINKIDGQTGVVRPGVEGILAIVAASSIGTANQPATFARSDLAVAAYGYGPLTEFASYVMPIAGNPVLLIKPVTSTAGAYSAVAHSGAGTSVCTADASVPFDDNSIVVLFVTGGTIGVAGITYKVSLDGGVTYSGLRALGTLTTLPIPNTGAALDFAAGTVLAGQTESVTTTKPVATDADLVATLEALRVTGAPWDAVLIDGIATASTVTLVDAFLAELETRGVYKTALLNTRMKAAGESEATYRAAMQLIADAASSIRLLLCVDGGDLVSNLTGSSHPRPASLGFAARGMASDISVDAARVSDGPFPGFQIHDVRGNPKYHDELLYPGLDDLRLASLRSFDGRPGTFANNPLLISPPGSDYVYWQQARVMNKACEIAYQLLTQRLSDGVLKDNATGYILESEAQDIEAAVNAEETKQLVTPQRVTGAQVVLSRTDDLSSNAGAILTGDVEVSALAYVKGFVINAKFVRRITASAV